MTVLDVFALFVLLVLIVSALSMWVILGMLPGRIARRRHHPQAEAISVCGWWGMITMGLLMPLAFIWAYTNPPRHASSQERAPGSTQPENTDEAAS